MGKRISRLQLLPGLKSGKRTFAAIIMAGCADGILEVVVEDVPGFTLVQLQRFVAVANAGSITLAASHLYIRQSSMSDTIKQLEKALKCKLFIRHRSRGVELTPDGRKILGKARQIVKDASEIADLSWQLQDDIAGTLDVGIYSEIAPFLRSALLKQLELDAPNLRVHVHEADFDAVPQLLRDGVCDLILTHPNEPADDFATIPLADLRLHALVSQDHPLAHEGRASLSALSPDPLIIIKSPMVQGWFLGFFDGAGVERPTIEETTTHEGLRSLVGAGLGFSIVYYSATSVPTLDGAHVTSLDIIDNVDTIPLVVQTLPEAKPSRRAQAFIDACKPVVANSMLSVK